TIYTQMPNMEATVFTQKTGEFAVDLPAGAYGLIVDLRGYAQSSPKPIEVKTGQKSEVKIALKPDQNGFDLESQITGAELLTLLPEDSRKTMLRRCAGCHSIGVLGGNRMSGESWAKVVKRMSMKEPPGRGEADTLAPWETNPWSGA